MPTAPLAPTPRGLRPFLKRRFSSDWYLIPLAAAIGAAGGVVATGFDYLVEFGIEFFFGLSHHNHFPGSEYLFLVLLPALGGLVVGLINRFTHAPVGEHGIPTVVEAFARKNGHVSTRLATTKALTSSLTIGSGGSAGVEGPIILIGSALGSAVGRILHIGREHMPTLVGCGAAASMAGIFNAPIAGVIFVLEVMLRDFSMRTFIPIVVASVFGTAVAQALLGANETVFSVPEVVSTGLLFSIREIGHYAVLGVLCGLVGVAFTAAMRGSETLWHKLPVKRWLKPMLGGLMLGLLGMVFISIFRGPVVIGIESPPFFGNGYRAIEAMLNPVSYVAGGDKEPGVFQHATLMLLLATLVLKFIGTPLTLASGGSGGIIAPSLMMGATLGGAFALGCIALNIFPGSTPATYALAGMAGVIAAVAHCPLTAFLLVFEITADYQVILPVMIVAIFATTVAQVVYPDSIYAAWLRDRGIRTGTYSDLTLLRRMTCHEVPLTPAVIVQPDDPAQRLLELAENYAVVDYVVADEEDLYLGMVVGQDVRATLVQRDAIPLMIVSELMRSDLPTVAPHQTLDVVLEEFARHDVSSLVVVDGDDRVKGVITRSRLMRQYQLKLAERA